MVKWVGNAQSSSPRSAHLLYLAESLVVTVFDQIHVAGPLCRKCEQNQVFFKAGDPHPHCKNDCEPHTMCGEVQVPEEHLEVCRVCNAFGQNCMVKGPDQPAGPGIENADFVFYISAMETERCQKGMTVAYAAHCQQESALDR